MRQGESLLSVANKNIRMHEDNYLSKLSYKDAVDFYVPSPASLSKPHELLLAPNERLPLSAWMSGLVYLVEKMAQEGSASMVGLRYKTTDILLQPNWLRADDHSQDRGVVAAMCVS